MDRKETGGPAFPRPASEYTESGTLPDGNNAINEQEGMTLQDYFAGQAAIAIMAQVERGRSVIFSEVATGAYGLANALIKERKK